MNWYFALSAASFASGDHDWPSLIRVAVHSARKNTSLIPHLLWDGPDHPFLSEMRRLGVTIINHRVGIFDDLVRFNPNPIYLATTTGCFLRTEIPILETGEPFVLYTDADVIFLRDPVPELKTLKPAFFAAAPEFKFDDALNSGVMLINVPTMRGNYGRFTRFIRQNLHIGLDQEMYRLYYANRYQKLSPKWNWKPYWGYNKNAAIIHWHGIKPVVVQRLLDDPAARTVPELQQLFERDRKGYSAYLHIFKTLLAEALQSSNSSLKPSGPVRRDLQAPPVPLSRHKCATQSSVAPSPSFLTPDADAGAAVNGHINGLRKCQTDIEDQPWWQVDLDGIARIRKIIVYGTVDHPSIRPSAKKISVSIDGAAWVDIARTTDEPSIGGVLFRWEGPGTAWARFVRVTLLSRDHLHLDQVEVFGEMAN